MGAGVLGPVFRALDPDRERMVGIKLFRLDMPPEQAASLADHLSTLVRQLPRHDALVPLVGAGVEGGSAYVVMDYVAADSVDQRLRRKVAAPLDQALPLLTQVAEGLDAAARAGYHHGALHPRDILVSTRGAVCVTGVGVVQALEAVGWRPPFRRPYAAPERLAGRPWDARADVFSLGVLALEIATGRRPLMPENAAALQWLGVGDQSRTAAVRDALAFALAEDPVLRDGSARAWITRLAESVAGDGSHLTTDVDDADDEAVAIAKAASESAPMPVDADEPMLSAFPSESSPAPQPESLAPLLPLLPSEEPAAPAREPLVNRELPVASPNADLPEVAVPPTDDVAAELSLPGPQTADDAALLHLDVPLRATEAATERLSQALAEIEVEPTLAEPEPGVPGPVGAPLMPVPEPPVPPSRTSTVPADDEPAGVPPIRDEHVFTPTERGVAATDAAPASLPRWEMPPADATGAGHPQLHKWWLPALAAALIVAFAIGFGAGSWWTRSSPRPPANAGAAPATTPATSQTITEEPVRVPGEPPRAPASGGVLEGPRSPESAAPAPRPSGAAPSAPPRAAAEPKGRLSVRTTPSGAEVRLNGAPRGRTPLTIRDLEYGTYRVGVSARGRVPVERRVTIGKNTPSPSITLELERAERPTPATAASPTAIPGQPSTLEVVTRPAGATVFVDGQSLGTSPLKLEIKPGAHGIRLELAGHRVWTTTITAIAGRPSRVAASLELSPQP